MSFLGAFCLSKAKCLFDGIMGCKDKKVSPTSTGIELKSDFRLSALLKCLKWKSDNYRREILIANCLCSPTKYPEFLICIKAFSLSLC